MSFSTLWSTATYRHELRNSSTSRYIVARASQTPPPPRPPHLGPLPHRGGLLSTLFSNLFHNGTNGSASTYPIVGYGGVWLTVDDAHITTIAVAPQYRGQGLGELLLNGLIDNAFDLHATTLTLEVRVSNIAAQQLYAKYGFQIGGRRLRYYTDNREDALIMSTESINFPEYRARLGELRQNLFARLRAQAEASDHLHN